LPLTSGTSDHIVREAEKNVTSCLLSSLAKKQGGRGGGVKCRSQKNIIFSKENNLQNTHVKLKMYFFLKSWLLPLCILYIVYKIFLKNKGSNGPATKKRTFFAAYLSKKLISI